MFAKEITMTVHFLNYLEDLLVGQTASYTKTFTEQDLTAFADATHDNNPVHFDEEFAKTTPFGGRVVHGMLTASLISRSLPRRSQDPGASI
jgi:3-hydroxybutyryl-CoA dehydratase